MRKLLLLLFVTIASQMLQAQNYNPFIFGKTYRYLYLNTDNSEFNGADSVVFIQKIIDATTSDNGTGYILLNTKTQILDNISFERMSQKDSIFYFFNYSSDLVFKINTKSKIGDTLYLGKNKYSTLKDIKFSVVVGVNDSVQVYEIKTKIGNKDSILGNVELSKNYGFVNLNFYYAPHLKVAKYYKSNLFSIDNPIAGFRGPMSYTPSIGDTIVWGTLTTLGNPPCTKDSFSVCTQKEIDDFIRSKFNYEIIDNNKYIGIFESLGMEGGIVYKYQEGLGKFESYFAAEMRSCTDGIAYYKGAQGEFGDRKRLTDLLTSIDNSEIAKYLNIYPNPSNKTIYVNSLNNSLVTIDIYDLQGSKIKSIQSEQQLTSFDLNSGLYLLKLNVDNKTFTQKVIVE